MILVSDRRTKIHELLHRRERSPYWLAKQLGKPKQSIYNVLDGSRPHDDSLWVEIARVLGVHESVLLDDAIDLPQRVNPGADSNAPGSSPPGAYRDREAHPRVGRRSFPLVGNVGAAEFPVFDGSPDDVEEFSDRLYDDRVPQMCVAVVGDSGESPDPTETGIKHGDIILFSVRPEYRVPGTYVVVAHRGEGAVVKILRRAPAGSPHEYDLVPENPDYPIIPIDDDNYRMVGPVLGLKRRKSATSYMEMGDENGLRPDGTGWKTR